MKILTRALSVFWHLSLRTQIAWVVGFMFSFVLLAQGLILFSVARDELKLSELEQLEILTSRVATELDDKVLMRVATLEAMASKFPPAALKSEKNTEDYFRNSPTLSNLIDDFYLFSPEGVLRIDWPIVPGRRGLNMVERDYIQGVIQHGRTTISKPILGRATKQPIIVIAVPLRDPHGKLTGILGGVVNLKRSHLLEPLSSTLLGQSGYFYLVGPERLTIMHPDKSRVLQPIAPPGLDRLLDRALTEDFEGAVEGTHSSGREDLLSFKRLVHTGWLLAAVLPANEALVAVDAMRMRVIFLTAVSLLLTIVLIVLIVRRFTQPLEELTDFLKSAKTLAAPPTLLHSCLETDRLSEAFAQFVLQQDSTQQKLAIASQEAELANADLRIAAIAFESQEGMFITDARSVILRVNQAFIDITGYSFDDAVNQTPRLLRSGHHDSSFYTTMHMELQRDQFWRGEIWNRRKNGDVQPEWLTIAAVTDTAGQVSHYVATLTDISQRKAAEEKIQNLAFYDTLTQLPNRRLLLERLQQALSASTRNGHIGALLFIDLDNFKVLNDTRGHDKGDLLLQQVAQRLTLCIRAGDCVARLGGDEFVLVLEDIGANHAEATAYARAVAEKILTLLNSAYDLAGQECHNSPSIGITLFPGHQSDMDELMKQADLAMYESKKAGRNTLRFFNPQMQANITARAGLEKDLRQSVQLNHFVLFYQPQVDAAARITGTEALLRWQHPQLGLISPAVFIPLAEDTGLILPLGRWVLETACKQLALWAKNIATEHLSIAVNVSALQFRQADFVEQVASVVERSGANPYRLKLELTETLLLDHVEDIIAKITALKARGIGFALDDFGTGYSSLSYLKRLPLDQLKIDQSFVRDLLIDPNDAAIARTIVALANSLGLSVIAEGVETEEQRVCLAAQGCHAYQGYLFGKPVPVAEFERLLTSV